MEIGTLALEDLEGLTVSEKIAKLEAHFKIVDKEIEQLAKEFEERWGVSPYDIDLRNNLKHLHCEEIRRIRYAEAGYAPDMLERILAKCGEPPAMDCSDLPGFD